VELEIEKLAHQRLHQHKVMMAEHFSVVRVDLVEVVQDLLDLLVLQVLVVVDLHIQHLRHLLFLQKFQHQYNQLGHLLLDLQDFMVEEVVDQILLLVVQEDPEVVVLAIHQIHLQDLLE